ncbi:hypothetical protein AWB81_08086 [Caballeronia arationis]|nr:hypothetical protein AWB81_08086 [Caballeronia arationis]
MLETLVSVEFMAHEARRIKVALQTAPLGTIKTLLSYGFAFQSRRDRDRLMSLSNNARLCIVSSHQGLRLSVERFAREASPEVLR